FVSGFLQSQLKWSQISILYLLYDMRKIIVIQEKDATFSIQKAGSISMKLCVFVVLLALMVLFLNFDQSYAQSSFNSSNATASYAVPSLTMTINETAQAAASSPDLLSNATASAASYDEYYKRANDFFDKGNYTD